MTDVLEAIQDAGVTLMVVWSNGDLRLRFLPTATASLVALVTPHKWSLIAHVLKARLERGLEMLIDGEEHDQMGTPAYERAFRLFLSVLSAYEIASRRLELALNQKETT